MHKWMYECDTWCIDFLIQVATRTDQQRSIAQKKTSRFAGLSPNTRLKTTLTVKKYGSEWSALFDVAQHPRELAFCIKTHGPHGPLMRQEIRMEWFDHTSEERQTFPWCRSWGDAFDMSRNRGDHLGRKNMGRIHLIWYTIQFFKRIYGTKTLSQKHLKNSIPSCSNQ